MIIDSAYELDPAPVHVQGSGDSAMAVGLPYTSFRATPASTGAVGAVSCVDPHFIVRRARAWRWLTAPACWIVRQCACEAAGFGAALPAMAHQRPGLPSSSPGNPSNPGLACRDPLNRSWFAQGPRLAMYDSARVLDPALVRMHIGSKQAAGLPSPSVGDPASSDAADSAAAPVSRLGAGLLPPPAGLGPDPPERIQPGAGGVLPLEGLGRGVEPQVERLTPHDSAGVIEASR